MEPQTLRFAVERETKNTVRYQEQTVGKPPAVGTLYVQRWLLGQAPPQRLVVVLREDAERHGRGLGPSGRARSPDPDGEPADATPTASRDPARDVAAGASFLSATRCSGARPRCPGRSTAAPSSSAATPPAAARSLTPRSSPLTTHSSANLPGRSAHRGRAVVSSASRHPDPRDHDDSFDLFVREPPEGDGEGHRRAGTRN